MTTPVYTDPRQLAYRGALNQLAPNGITMLTVDQLIASTETELTPPLALRASNPASLVLNISSVIVTNPQTNRNRTIPPISSIIPNFTSATVTFPSSGTGTVTTSAGSATLTLAMAANQSMIVAMFLDANGNINFTGGTPAASITAPFTVPQISGLLPIGFAIISTNGSNVVQSVTNANLYQLPVGGGGSGTGNANTILETVKNQLVDSPYQLVTTNITATAGQALYSSITGAAYDIVTNTIKFTADGQTAVSTNMVDTTEFLPQGVDIGSIDLSAFWNKSTGFAIPTSKTFTYSAASVTNASATVTLTIPNHGLTSGKKVYIQTSTAIGGISSANLSVSSATITVVDANTITYTAGASATSSATGSVDFVISGFVFLASRDGGNNYYPVAMSQVGTTEAFYGSLRWGQNQTTETGTSLASTTGGTQTLQDLNNHTQFYIAQSFSVPSNANWVVTGVTVTVTKTSTPSGTLYVSLYATSGGLPTGNALAVSTPISISTLSSGTQTFAVPTTVLTGGTSGTTYAVVFSTDTTYQNSFSNSNKIQLTQTTASTGESIYTGSAWSAVSGEALLYSLVGRAQDLRVKILAASDTSLTYPVGLDGYGLFYNLQNVGIVGATKKTQRFVFNSVTDNLSSFTITSFIPDPDLLSCYWVEGGQVFKAPAFSVQGNTVVFPSNTFNQAGVSQTITLIFDQNSGGAFDNSDVNAQLLAANHLGSTNGAIDKSKAGSGVVLRDNAGTLREISLDSSGYLQVLSSPGGSVMHSMGLATDTVPGLSIRSKQYVVGTAYTNGTPTITSGQAGFAVTRAVLIPYQTVDGAWRLRSNGVFTMTAASLSAMGAIYGLSVSLTFTGVTFANISSGYQPGAAMASNSGWLPSGCYANPNTSTVVVTLLSYNGAGQSQFTASFDVELAGKPTWAD